MKVLSVTLKRKKLGNYENLIGRLKVETDRGTFFFSTMENYVHKIPQGTYEIKYTYSPKFKREMLLLLVQGRTGIRIHSANRGAQLQGCIAIGAYNTSLDVDQIYYSKDNTDIVESMLHNQPMKIKIINDYEERTNKKSCSQIITEAFRFGA